MGVAVAKRACSQSRFLGPLPSDSVSAGLDGPKTLNSCHPDHIPLITEPCIQWRCEGEGNVAGTPRKLTCWPGAHMKALNQVACTQWPGAMWSSELRHSQGWTRAGKHLEEVSLMRQNLDWT